MEKFEANRSGMIERIASIVVLCASITSGMIQAGVSLWLGALKISLVVLSIAWAVIILLRAVPFDYVIASHNHLVFKRGLFAKSVKIDLTKTELVIGKNDYRILTGGKERARILRRYIGPEERQRFDIYIQNRFYSLGLPVSKRAS